MYYIVNIMYIPPIVVCSKHYQAFQPTITSHTILPCTRPVLRCLGPLFFAPTSLAQLVTFPSTTLTGDMEWMGEGDHLRRRVYNRQRNCEAQRTGSLMCVRSWSRFAAAATVHYHPRSTLACVCVQSGGW